MTNRTSSASRPLSHPAGLGARSITASIANWRRASRPSSERDVQPTAAGWPPSDRINGTDDYPPPIPACGVPPAGDGAVSTGTKGETMFPDINAGDVIVIDGDKYLVVMHLPDAFVILTLGADNDRVFQLSFEDIEEIHSAGLLSVQGPLMPRVPGGSGVPKANADD